MMAIAARMLVQSSIQTRLLAMIGRGEMGIDKKCRKPGVLGRR